MLQGVFDFMLPNTDWRMPTDFPDLSAAERIAVDVETCDPNLRDSGPGSIRKDGYVVGISVGTDDWRGYYPIRHNVGDNLLPSAVLSWLNDQLSRPNQPKVGANILYDLEWLRASGVTVAGPFYDVQIAEPLLDENRHRYSLDELAKQYVPESGGKETQVLFEAAQTYLKSKSILDARMNLWKLPAKYVGAYAEADVQLPLQIFDKQRKKLKKEGLWELFLLETRLIPMLLEMRFHGTRVDLKRAEKLHTDLERKERELQKELKRQVGLDINVWASESIVQAFDLEGIEYPKTDKGNPSFTSDFLRNCEHPVAQLIDRIRHTNRMRSSFVENAILNSAIDGRIHTQFHQLRGDDGGTVSGRFSSSNPNLQQVPVRDEIIGPLIRGLFIPEEDCLWASSDWSQIEYRYLVHYAFLIKARGAAEARQQYHDDPRTDFHMLASEITGIPRRPAKNINFGIVYGMGRKKLQRQLGVSEEEADRIMNTYDDKMPFARETYQYCSRVAAKRGFIKTVLNRRRRFDLYEPDRWNEGGYSKPLPHEEALKQYGRSIRRVGTHKALNSVLQGSAADLMKKAMVDIYESGVCDVLGVPHIVVHDENDNSMPRTKEGLEAQRELVHIMETCIEIEVPIYCDCEIGPNWGNTKPISEVDENAFQ